MKKKRRLLSVIFLTTLMLYSCKDDFDDNLSLDLINDNVFVDENGNEFGTGILNCTYGSYTIYPDNVVNVTIPDLLPDSYDLSIFLPPIGNQGRQGSCVSWATTYYLKSFQERIQSGLPYNNTRTMSPAFTYNQLTQGNCTGTTFENTLDILKNQGTVSLAEFPYDENSCTVQPTPQHVDLAEVNKIASYKYLSGSNMVLEMKALLLEQTPILISTFLTPNFGKTDNFGLTAYREHTVNLNQSGTCHAMLVVGYSNEFHAFKVVNSWGLNWGDNGYVWIDYEAFANVLNQNYSFKVINSAIVVYDL
jgi:cathepsin K